MSRAIQFPCKICKYKVTNSDQAISCDLCASRVDIKCNELNQIDYKFLHNPNDPWFVSHVVAKFSLLILWKIETLSPISMIVTINLKTLMKNIALYY